MSRSFARGDIVLVNFPEHRPSLHEQQGFRPAIVVGIPPGETRYMLVVIAPTTTKSGEWVEANQIMYPVLPAGTGNLSQESVVLLDQIRAVDARRIVRYVGQLTEEEYLPIASGIAAIFG